MLSWKSDKQEALGRARTLKKRIKKKIHKEIELPTFGKFGNPSQMKKAGPLDACLVDLAVFSAFELSLCAITNFYFFFFLFFFGFFSSHYLAKLKAFAAIKHCHPQPLLEHIL